MPDKKLDGPPAHADSITTDSAPDDLIPHDLIPLKEIREAISRVQFGTVQLIIQAGRVVQIETTEKRRLV